MKDMMAKDETNTLDKRETTRQGGFVEWAGCYINMMVARFERQEVVLTSTMETTS